MIDEMRLPKYAHIERERRWLIDPERLPTLDQADAVLIEDRYIAGTRLRLRRMHRRHDGRLSLKLTRKYEATDPLARPIVTTYLDEDEYALLATLPASPIVKTRLSMTIADMCYSVDQFQGLLDGLVLAEIEWSDDVGLRALPDPPAAICEVSDDPRYQSGALAALGLSKE